MEEKKHKKIELRSEEVQEVMGQIPHWILRWGIMILFIVVLMLVVGSYFFRYPDVILTKMTLTGQSPAAQIVARTSGKMATLYVADGDHVSEGTVLAIIENSASTVDVLFLKGQLSGRLLSPDSILSVRFGELALGEIQPSYASFLSSLHEYRNYRDLNYYPQKIESTRRQKEKYLAYYDNVSRQRQVMEDQHRIAGQQYARDSLLFARNVLSPSEHESSQTTWLQSQYSLEGANASLENLQIQIGQLEETLLDLELQKAEKESQLLQSYRISSEQLMNAIAAWELNYCLRSSINGVVTFTTYWNENQNIRSGDNVFTVIPHENEVLIGKAQLASQRSGKVAIGQRVIVRFLNYPDQEFGIVNGKVSSISLVPSEGNYMVEVAFPNGLTTNYGITLPVSYEMTASAEIVTEELRLIERFFMPLKQILKEGFGPAMFLIDEAEENLTEPDL